MEKKLSAMKQEMVEKLSMDFPSGQVTPKQLREWCVANGYPRNAGSFIYQNSDNKISRGLFRLPNMAMPAKVIEMPTKQPAPSAPVVKQSDTLSFTPEKVANYVRFGHFNDVKMIVSSSMFYPLFITGLSGNGKTMMIEQVHAELKREMIRVNITIETDEDDLIGHYSLVNGETVWQDGPVVIAMQRGATLLLDEIDLASNKIMCLQPVLEGNSLFLKKEGRVIHPQKGFNVIATANTKGKGSDDGRFIGTNILNEAFLERFPITLEQDYPSLSVEKKILNKLLDSLEFADSEFVDRVCDWADLIRKTFYEGGVDEIITTRRLVHICNAYAIFKDRAKAIAVCISRFDDQTKEVFMDLYGKLDETVGHTSEEQPQADTMPF